MHQTPAHSSRVLIHAAALALLLLLILLLLPGPRAGAAPFAPDAGAATCRAGVAGGVGNVLGQIGWLPTLGAGWYLNFGVTTSPLPNNVEFVRMVQIHQPRDGSGGYLPGYTINVPLTPQGLGGLVTASPGALWIVGNEIDRIGQGEIFPDQYAIAYHDVYHYIKSVDPTAQVAPSALVQVTPNRLQYLDLLWNAYQQAYGVGMPVDVWTMHLYILPEVQPDGVTPNGIASVAMGTDPQLGKVESNGNASLCPSDDVYCFAEHDNLTVFSQQVLAMRYWMRDHGYRDRPLLITEYSLLYPYELDGGGCFLQDEYGACFTPARVASFLSNSFAYLELAAAPGLGYPRDKDRLVQQWLWYSLNTNLAGEVSDLVNESATALTTIGARFRDEVAARPKVANLVAERAIPVVVADGSGTASLALTVANNGNTGVSGPFTVAFYNDATNALIGTAVVDGLDGCGRRVATARVNWNGLAPGLYRYRAVADSGQIVGESSESDNATTGTVLVEPVTRLLLPVANRALMPLP